MALTGIFALLCVVSTIFGYPTAQHDQIMVHRTPTHDVMYIPDFMLADVPMRGQQGRNSHGRMASEGYSHVRHQHHEEPQPQKICLQQVPQEVPHHHEEFEFQPEQPQHIVLNPNHAVYISTQDDYGNLRTFKISQNSPFLKQTMLTGQEIPMKQNKNVEPAVEANVETTEKKVVEEIAEIKEAEIPQETPKIETEIVQEPVQKPIYADKKKSRKGKIEQVKKPVEPELSEETQIETPTVELENESSDVPSVEEDESEAVKMVIVEETPSEEVAEETFETVEPNNNKNLEEIVVVAVDDKKDQTKAEVEPKHQNETFEIVSAKKEDSDEKTDEDHEIFAESGEDKHNLFSGEHHSIEKRDVSAETLEGIEIEEEVSEEAAQQPADEPETFKKDLTETVEEEKKESEIMETTPAPKIEEPAIPDEQVEIIEALPPIESKEKEVAPKKDDFVMEIPKRRLSSRRENIAAKENVVFKEPSSESKVSEQIEETLEKVEEEIEQKEEEVAQQEPVSEEKEVESDEVKDKEDVDEKVEEAQSQENTPPIESTTPAPSVEGFLPEPVDIMSTTTPLPILLDPETFAKE